MLLFAPKGGNIHHSYTPCVQNEDGIHHSNSTCAKRGWCTSFKHPLYTCHYVWHAIKIGYGILFQENLCTGIIHGQIGKIRCTQIAFYK